MLDEITYPFSNFNDCAPPLKFGKISNFIPHFMMNLIIHTFCNLSSSMYIQRDPIYHLRGFVAHIYRLPTYGAALLRGEYMKMIS